jgi:hypothetical protein
MLKIFRLLNQYHLLSDTLTIPCILHGLQLTISNIL